MISCLLGLGQVCLQLTHHFAECLSDGLFYPAACSRSGVTISAHNLPSRLCFQHIAHASPFAKWLTVIGTTLETIFCPQHAPWVGHYELCRTLSNGPASYNIGCDKVKALAQTHHGRATTSENGLGKRSSLIY